MTVRQLIERLQAFDPDMPVVATQDSGPTCGEYAIDAVSETEIESWVLDAPGVAPSDTKVRAVHLG